MSTTISGIAASAGIAIAKAFLLKNPDLIFERTTIENPELELNRLKTAIEQSKAELRHIQQKAETELGHDKAEIFGAHVLLLEDPELISAVKDKISTDKINAESAWDETANLFISLFENMDNEYMKERAADIRDISKRVLSHLLGLEFESLSSIAEEVILVAEDLTPSDTAQLNRQYVKGFAADIGGRTSHSAIMARSMEIPAVVGTKHITQEIQPGTLLILDGIHGQVIVNPTAAEIADYRGKREAYELQKKELKMLVNQSTLTQDGQHVELAANIGKPGDIESVLEHGAEGIGLFRTEFLYMDRDQLPTEEEQLQAYQQVLQQMKGKPVVIRTLDIGGDKKLPYLNLPSELNPFLGVRAIRLCLEQQDIFRTQLRALLRASVFGNLKIMFPMVATLDEFRQAKAILAEEKSQLVNRGVAVSDTIEVGIMVEIPSTAVMADRFAKEVDFFSIGTNDLIQYTMAADRMNEHVSYLYQPYNPAILRLIQSVIQAAHQQGKWVGMCGEMAGDEIAIPILLGLGLDEFSMSATSILFARRQISKLSQADAASFTEKILSMDTAEEVAAFVKETFQV